MVTEVSRTLVYQNDFETSAGSEWSNTTRSTAPSGRNFLGEFGNQTVSLALGNLPGHSTMALSFDLYIIRSWDGNSTLFNNAIIGPDIWELNVTDGPTLLHATFHNEPLGRQAYPDNYPAGDHPGLTGAVEIGTLGYSSPFVSPADSVYHISHTFAHTASNVVVNFVGSVCGIGKVFNKVRDKVEFRVICRRLIRGWLARRAAPSRYDRASS